MLIVKKSENREKALAYIRVSSQRQADEGVSLDAQKRRILEYANFKNIPLDKDDIIIERGVSGGIPLWDRPKGRALKRKLSSGQYQHLISMKIYSGSYTTLPSRPPSHERVYSGIDSILNHVYTVYGDSRRDEKFV